MKASLAITGLLLLSGLGQGWAQSTAPHLEPVRTLDAKGFVDDDDDPAMDLSGIACMPSRGTERACMVINDEDRSAQLAVLTQSQLVGGAKVKLIGKKHSEATLGEPPNGVNCSAGEAKFKDLDGEAVAFSGAYFYVAGSHGCSRNSDKFRPSSFILARIRVDPEGRPVGEADTSYRLGAVLGALPTVGGNFGADLNGANGLNIEGMAVVGERLWIGLRAPVLDGKAFLVSVNADHLFSKAATPPAAEARVVPVPLGKDTGIRDLATTPDGRLLVLSGPAQAQADIGYAFFLVDPQAPEPRRLATIGGVSQGGETGKAEGVVVVDATADALRVVVVFDGLKNGGAREYVVPMR